MQILVREMQPSEKGNVEKLFGRSLGIIDRIVFQLSFEDAQKSVRKQSGGTLTAEYDGKIVGAVSMRIQTLKDKRIGYIDAPVADKELRGSYRQISSGRSHLMARGARMRSHLRHSRPV